MTFYDIISPLSAVGSDFQDTDEECKENLQPRADEERGQRQEGGLFPDCLHGGDFDVSMCGFFWLVNLTIMKKIRLVY